MKKIYIALIAVLLAAVGFLLIKPIFNRPVSPEKAETGKVSFELTDQGNKIKMSFPDSVAETSGATIISGVRCEVKNYVCSTGANSQVGLMIITAPEGTNDTSLKNIVLNYFPGVDTVQNFKAGKLEGLKYQTYICGVPVENFIGIAGNKIYHFSETAAPGDSQQVAVSHLGKLMIDSEGQSLKTLLFDNKQTSIVDNDQLNRKKSAMKTAYLPQDVAMAESSTDIRIDISSEAYQLNPDSVLYLVKQRYYMMEGSFSRAIACNFENGTSHEYIVYPEITFAVKLYESSKAVKPYKISDISYKGNAQGK
jgi:hypothetical protein